MLIMYFNAEIQIVTLVNFTLLSQRSFVPSLASVTKSAVVGHFLSLREPTKGNCIAVVVASRMCSLTAAHANAIKVNVKRKLNEVPTELII